MTAAETAAIRKARKSAIRDERMRRVAEYRERRRRRQAARQGVSPRVSSEPTYEATRGALFTVWCEPGRHPFKSDSFQATVCEGHRGE